MSNAAVLKAIQVLGGRLTKIEEKVLELQKQQVPQQVPQQVTVVKTGDTSATENFPDDLMLLQSL